MGFWRRVVRAIGSVLGGGPQPSPPPSEPPPASSGADFDFGYPEPASTELPDPSGLPFEFDIAGWLPLGGTYNSDFENLEGYASGPDAVDWQDADYVVVKITEPNGSTYYTTLVGPFGDYDDWYDALVAWWREGSP